MASHATAGGSQAADWRSAHSSASANAASLWPQLTFTQGFVVGQLSIIIVVIALIRYLLFEQATPEAAHDGAGDEHDAEDQGTETGSTANRSRHFPSLSSQNQKGQSIASLLSLSLSSAPPRAKSPPPASLGAENGAGSGPNLLTLARIPDAVGFDMETAVDIDVGWLNVLLAHVWEGYRDDFLAGGSSHQTPSEAGDDGEWEDVVGVAEEAAEVPSESPARCARDLMEEIINRPKVEEGKMAFLDSIKVTECLLGTSYPILSNARVRPRDDQGRVRIELDVDYSDLLSLSLQTAILVNWPRERFAVLPISLGLRITRFSGTLSLSFSSHPPASTPSTNRSRHSLEVSLHPDFLLLATCSSLVGSRAKLQDIPKIQQLILQRIRQSILDKFGWPKSWTVEMPDLVRRRRPRRRRYGPEADAELDHYYNRNYMEGIVEEDGDDFGDEGFHAGFPDGSRPPLRSSNSARRAHPTPDGRGPYRRSQSSMDFGHTTPDAYSNPLFDAQRTPKAKQSRAAAGNGSARHLDSNEMSRNAGSSSSRRAMGSGQFSSSGGAAGGPTPPSYSRSSSYNAPAAMAAGGRRPVYRPTPSSSQITSISRRGPNPHRYSVGDEYEQENVGVGEGHPIASRSGHARPGPAAQSGFAGRRSGRAAMNGDSAGASTGVMPGVEEWRKEMVRRTHGGTPGP